MVKKINGALLVTALICGISGHIFGMMPKYELEFKVTKKKSMIFHVRMIWISINLSKGLLL